MDQTPLESITQELLALGRESDHRELFPTLEPEVAPLVVTDPYAFALAACLDRGMKAEVAWTIPFYLKAGLGHLDPQRIAKMSLGDPYAALGRLPRKPRYLRAAPRTIAELTAIVVGRARETRRTSGMENSPRKST